MIDFLMHLFSSFWFWWYVVVFVFSFLENFVITGWLFPATFLLSIFAFLSSLWYYFWLYLIILAFLGNFVWSIVSYHIWLRVWKKVFKKWFKFLKADFFINSQKYFLKYSAVSIIFWKFIPWIRETICFIAGVYHLNKIKFYIYSFLWALFWASWVVTIVYIFSYSFNLAIDWLERIW